MSYLRVAAKSCGGILLTVALSVTLQAADPACQVMLDAAKKLETVPNHVYLTRVAGFKGKTPEAGESITVGGVIYVMANGKWRRIPVTPAERIQQAEETAASGKQSCKYLRDEAVNGEAAAVYTEHTVLDDGSNDSTLWISKKSGLPLREEIDIDVGGGATGKSHTSGRFEYTNVHPPAGVQ